jgi:hypothetical protein
MSRAISFSKLIDTLIALINIARKIINSSTKILCYKLWFITLLQKFLKYNNTNIKGKMII